jgi:two-component system NtrC family sensor kinase
VFDARARADLRVNHSLGPAAIMRLARRLFITAQIIGTSLHAVIWVENWDRRPGLWILFGLFVLVSIGNPLIAATMHARLGHSRAEDVRNALNVVVHAAVGVICGWSQTSWLFIPFLVGLASVPPATRAGSRTFAMLVVIDACAIASGARGVDIITFTAISLAFHFLLEAYLSLANNLVIERERALEELAATQKLVVANARLASIGQIAAGVAHEINNPMCYVTANIEQLLEDMREGDLDTRLLDEYRDMILPETLDGIARVNSIVDDLRRFARGEPEQHADLDFSNEVRTACRMARMQAGPDREIHLDIADGIQTSGMRRQLGQVVLNLVVNALQALEERGNVYVGLAVDGGAIILEVRDDGIGMTEETKQRVFDPFFTTKSAGRGTGLGLSVVHGIVKAHRGEIEVESAPRCGTKFVVRLPLRAGLTA